MSSITTHFWWLQCLNFWPFFALSSGKKREKKVSRRSWRAGSREEKHQWGLSSEAVWLLLSVSSLAAFTTCRYTSLSSFNGRLRGDLSGAELLLSAGDSYDARGARSTAAVRATTRSAVQCTGGLAPPRCFRRSARRYFGREERESYRLLVLLRVARFSDQMLSSGRHLF